MNVKWHKADHGRPWSSLLWKGTRSIMVDHGQTWWSEDDMGHELTWLTMVQKMIWTMN